MALEDSVKEIFKEILDIEPEEIKGNEPLEAGLGMDSTELVEVSVALKKRFKIDLGDGELKKQQTFDDIVAILKTKGAN